MNFKETTVSSKVIYKGHIIDVYLDEVMCPNGNIAPREVVRHCEAVCILAFLENGSVLLEKQYRYPYDEMIYELPAGKIDKDEDKEHAAIRELEEETGYLAKKITYLGSIYPSCAYTDEIIHLYLATDLIKTKQHLDENEYLEICEISLKELIDMIAKQQIKDAKSLCALQYYLVASQAIKL